MARSLVHRARVRASRSGDRFAIAGLRFLLVAALGAVVAVLERGPVPDASRFVLAVGDALIGAPLAPLTPTSPRAPRATETPAGGRASAGEASAGQEAARAIALRDAARALGAKAVLTEPMVSQRTNGWAPLVSAAKASARDERGDPLPTPAPVDLPRSWEIEAGLHAGREIALDVEGATGGAAGWTNGGGYWRLTRARAGRPPRAVAWATDSLPVRLVLDRSAGSSFTPRDSIVVWTLVRELEEELGMRLFRPANPAEVAPEDPAADGVRVRVSPAIGTAGRTYLAYDQEGRIGEAEVNLAAHAYLADRRVLKHELLHALGFGHTAAWSSLLSRGGSVAHATAEDAAHARAWYAVRGAQERGGGVLRGPGPAVR